MNKLTIKGNEYSKWYIPRTGVSEETIRNLKEEQITTEGEIIGLKCIIFHQSDKITHLQESARQVTAILEDIVLNIAG